MPNNQKTSAQLKARRGKACIGWASMRDIVVRPIFSPLAGGLAYHRSSAYRESAGWLACAAWLRRITGMAQLASQLAGWLAAASESAAKYRRQRKQPLAAL